jgi:hypothetical protein
MRAYRFKTPGFKKKTNVCNYEDWKVPAVLGL